MRICVFGAGAVGGYLAARLAGAGNVTSVVARGAHLDAIKRDGIVVHSKAGSFTAAVRATGNAAELGPQDAVLVTLKATALAGFAEQAALLMNDTTMVVFCQNGIPWWYKIGLRAGRPAPPDLSRLDPGGILARRIPPDRIIGGVVYSPNEVERPGVVVNTGDGADRLLVGELDDRASDRIVRLRAVLSEAGFGSPDAGDIRAAAWRKLVGNLSGSAIGLLTEKETDVIARDAGLAAVSRRLGAEVAAIANAHGVAIDGPARGGRAPSHHKASLLQDYEAKRPMEIEAIFMAPLAFARCANVDVPVLQTVAALAARRAAERGLYQPPEETDARS
jgi:2-dehydropantoate 2-reductase